MQTPYKFDPQAILDHRGYSMHSSHYTTSVNHRGKCSIAMMIELQNFIAVITCNNVYYCAN